MTKRAKLITALVAAIGLVVVSPLAAVAYWSVNAPLALTAQASTFALSPYSVAPASPASSTSFTGWKTTQFYAAPLTNSGTTPWASETVALAAASGFGPAAVATVQVAFTASASACQNEATYSGITARSALAASTWSSTTVVAGGGTLHACIKLVVTDTDTHSNTGQAPADVDPHHHGDRGAARLDRPGAGAARNLEHRVGGVHDDRQQRSADPPGQRARRKLHRDP
nr:hypothetical protein GCM10025699_14930 [Microbacterium flavescens]